ncbi:hypothetical protein M878_08440 [Streptomyces roseochromogenus subsp. oscitans DS 12.976]|uniref:Major facilitator superfamily (MFS) profile domain-containing protein n=2 Tax=Streptomyces roseochromogenus TaxID=285450 RepID=V6KRX2_STRRC|nr:hypothetical protein M878_08440 [Streptomyces roseochromogenus subsp. oscitans DS 12.976]
MTFIDETGVGVALAVIHRELHTSRAGTHWVMNAYMLTLAALVAAGGRLSDLYGRRRTFAAGLTVFGLGSLLCATAPGLTWLITWRAVQGCGAALLIPTALAIVSQTFPPAERGRAVGAYIGAASVFYVIGPVLTGALVDQISWRAVFWINVPIACAVGVIVAAVIPRDIRSPRRERLDLPGLATSAAGLAALVIALMQGPSWGWSSLPTVLLYVAAVVLSAAFTLTELRRPAPLFNLAILRDTVFAGAVAMVFLVYVVYLGLIVFAPLFLQHEAGLRPLMAGLALAVALGPIIAVAPLTGRVVDRAGPRRPALITGLTAIAAFSWLAIAAPARSLPWTVPALLLYGISVPAVYNCAVTAAQNRVTDEQRGQASGIITSAAQTGATIGVAVIGAVVAPVSDSADYTTTGFQAGFTTCAGFSALLALLALALPRTPSP